MSKLGDVRALFVPGEQVECVANTYWREEGALRTWTVDRVGKSVWFPKNKSGENWRGTFPTRAADVLDVNAESATWRIGRGDHTVTYRKVA